MARLGILPFFWVACLVVYGWGKRYYGAGWRWRPLFFFSFLPPILAHAGLATTDMALTAFLGAAFLTGLRLGGGATRGRTARSSGCARAWRSISKFSSLVFFPAAVALALAGMCSSTGRASGLPRHHAGRRRAVCRLALAALAGASSLGAVSVLDRQVDFLSAFRPRPLLRRHPAGDGPQRQGHPSYLLGQHSQTSASGISIRWCWR